MNPLIGESRAPVLELTLQDYLDQMMAMPVDWKAETLEAASERAASFAKELVPGLAPSTYAGMSKYFAYEWR